MCLFVWILASVLCVFMVPRLWWLLFLSMHTRHAHQNRTPHSLCTHSLTRISHTSAHYDHTHTQSHSTHNTQQTALFLSRHTSVDSCRSCEWRIYMISEYAIDGNMLLLCKSYIRIAYIRSLDLSYGSCDIDSWH